jgi:hypothetical protein
VVLVAERAYAGILGSVKGKHIDSVSGRIEKLVLKPVTEMLRQTGPTVFFTLFGKGSRKQACGVPM